MSHSLQAGKQEPDNIQFGPIFLVAAIIASVVVLTYLGVRHFTDHIIARNLLRPQLNTHVERVATASNGEPLKERYIPKFGMLHQTLFRTVSDAQDIKTASEDRLHSYGWEKSHQVAHIPIDRAMKIVEAQRAAPPPAPAPVPVQPAPPAPAPPANPQPVQP